MFKSKKDKFAVLLLKISANLKEATKYFTDFKINNLIELKVFSDKMKEFEVAGDDLVHEMLLELNNTFITPIEREDLLALTSALDDVLDELEHCSALREMFSVIKLNEFELSFVHEINSAVLIIYEAIDLLLDKKLNKIGEKTIAIKDHETKSDNIYRQAIKQLFSLEKDPIQIMKRKGMYETLEFISDACQDVAHILDQIIMKNA